MKIVSVFLEENNKTKIVTDAGNELYLDLKPYFRIPYRCLEIDFESEEQLKEFCIENQTLGL